MWLAMCTTSHSAESESQEADRPLPRPLSLAVTVQGAHNLGSEIDAQLNPAVDAKDEAGEELKAPAASATLGDFVKS